MNNKYPAISIIAPVYNDEKYIRVLLKSLMEQDYPRDQVEIIIVDNGSQDGSREIVKEYRATLLVEDKIQSSYAARNQGIDRARHDILAFIDSDCKANSQWLKEGVKALEPESVDLAGGKVEFIFSSRKTAGEYCDSLRHFNFEKTIKEQKATGAGNLFVKSYVFAKVGKFSDQVKSGGDFQWTRQAVESGFNLVFADKAVVYHPTRTAWVLTQKSLRVGIGMIPVWLKRKRTITGMIKSVGRLFLPPSVRSIEEEISENGTPDMLNKKRRMWWVTYLCNAATGLGGILGLIKAIFRRTH